MFKYILQQPTLRRRNKYSYSTYLTYAPAKKKSIYHHRCCRESQYAVAGSVEHPSTYLPYSRGVKSLTHSSIPTYLPTSYQQTPTPLDAINPTSSITHTHTKRSSHPSVRPSVRPFKMCCHRPPPSSSPSLVPSPGPTAIAIPSAPVNHCCGYCCKAEEYGTHDYCGWCDVTDCL